MPFYCAISLEQKFLIDFCSMTKKNICKCWWENEKKVSVRVFSVDPHRLSVQ